MYCKKKYTPVYVAHPFLCATATALCVIGTVGVAMAVKKKAKKIAAVAETVGCACVQNVKEAAESMMDSGMDMMTKMLPKKDCCSSTQ